ncbi:hypothetical protein [Streptomyces sp. H39-C1]|uniref:hypothetical protein n=1 Tax=Streptomyces sp. H39-C1 TaxID=3004355 RepID=UPI0022AF5EFD|nr:hypothetical protein [Streptomyces sp. H39-C1]MCZ4102529.1 hypothetical protein [Streptomyces sp. H39-C1]
MRRPTRRQTGITATGGALVIGITAVVLSTGGGTQSNQAPTAVSTIDSQLRACMLTDATADDKTIASVWAGLTQAATQRTDLIVQRHTLPPAVAPATYLNTLAQMRCTTIVTVGETLRAPVAADTTGHHYVVISKQPVAAAHTTSLTPGQATANAVASAVTAAT